MSVAYRHLDKKSSATLDVVSVGTPPPVKLANDLYLIIDGNLGDAEPYAVRAELATGSGGHRETHPMIAETFSVAGLASEVARDRFRSQAEALYPGEAEFGDALDAALADLADAVADGEVTLTDRTANKLIDATRGVEYDPSEGEWRVQFNTENAAVSSVLQLSAEEWTSNESSAAIDARIPSTISMTPFGDSPARWRSVRSIWQGMATETDSENEKENGN